MQKNPSPSQPSSKSSPRSSSRSPSRAEVWKMFNQIAPTYDILNRVLSLGLDQYWRRKLLSFLPEGQDLTLLDCATGTGDQIFAFMDKGAPIASAIGIDLAEKMIEKAQEKLLTKPYADRVSWQVGSGTALPFGEQTFDCVSLSFGIRNMTDPVLCMRELYRVLRPGGRALILEFSLPTHSVLRTLHLLYLRYVLPRIGGWVSKNKQAYAYLNETIETFFHGETFCTLMREAGFETATVHPLAGGIVSIYQGVR